MTRTSNTSSSTSKTSRSTTASRRSPKASSSNPSTPKKGAKALSAKATAKKTAATSKTTAKKGTKKTPAKKTATKKATTKKTPAKKGTAKKTTAKSAKATKTATKTTKKVSAKKVSSKKTAAKKTTAKRTTAKKAATKKATAKKPARTAAKKSTKTKARTTVKTVKSTTGKKKVATKAKSKKVSASKVSEMAAAMFSEHDLAGEDEAMRREAALDEKRRDLLERLAVSSNRYDDLPNQELASQIVFHLDQEAVSILVSVIETHDDVHAPDAARVVFEVGSRDEELVLPFIDRLVDLCCDEHFEVLPFSMYALAPLGHHAAEHLWDVRDLFWQAISEADAHMEMTQVAAVKLLSALCAASPDYARTLAGGLVDLLGKCPPNDVAMFAESVLPALGAAHSHRAKPVLDRRMKELTPAEVARLRRAVRMAQSGNTYSYAA